uniref:Transposase n=1 Tax=Oryza brachyantha TaxID=4533 RepID=J3LPX8_ORYBR
MRSYLISKVLHVIISCWPQEDAHNTIWIQQDNTPSHVRVDDPQFAHAVAQTGFDFCLMY